jgi:hypothetical protein
LFPFGAVSPTPVITIRWEAVSLCGAWLTMVEADEKRAFQRLPTRVIHWL